MTAMRRNPHYLEMAKVCEQYGFAYSTQQIGKHPVFCVDTPKGSVKMGFPSTPSDSVRGHLNSASDLKRLLRERGLIEAASPPPPPPPPLEPKHEPEVRSASVAASGSTESEWRYEWPNRTEIGFPIPEHRFLAKNGKISAGAIRNGDAVAYTKARNEVCYVLKAKGMSNEAIAQEGQKVGLCLRPHYVFRIVANYAEAEGLPAIGYGARNRPRKTLARKGADRKEPAAFNGSSDLLAAIRHAFQGLSVDQARQVALAAIEAIVEARVQVETAETNTRLDLIKEALSA